MVHPVQVGKRTRMSFAKVKDVTEMPNLIEVQLDSYEWFLKEGLLEVFDDINPISNFTGNLVLEFVDYKLDMDNIKYSVEECKERDSTYAAPLKVSVRLTNNDTGEIKEQEVFMGDFPLMTEQGTFIINGAERVVVSQLVRSPGVYYSNTIDKSGKKLFASTVIPNRGAWLEYETDSNDVIYVRIDKTRKLPISILARAMGYGSDQELLEYFGEEERFKATIEKDNTKTREEALLEIYKRLRPGEPPTVDSAVSLIDSLFFDAKRYDLSRVGRYKFNRKLAINLRLINQIAAVDVINPSTGEVMVEQGEKISREMAEAIQCAGINSVDVLVEDRVVRVIGNYFVDINKVVPFDISDLNIREFVHYPTLMEILDNYDDEATIKEEIKKNITRLIPKHIVRDDIFATISYEIGLAYGIGYTDDIDHLGNRRLRSVGELLQNQFRIGLSRMERVVKERMTIQDQEAITPQMLINIRPVAAAIKEFFGSSQLSQFMDQTNPLSELTHKRRLSALGPGGLSRERAGMEVRDVNSSHYGRICPIESPEGQNIGLITSLAGYAKVNEYGFITTPYHKVNNGVVDKDIIYMTADEETDYYISQATVKLDKDNRIIDDEVLVRVNGDNVIVKREEVDYVDVAPSQVVAVTTSCIPFLEFDDAKRTLMGANMQRQAVPLLTSEAPIVGTGVEYIAASSSGSCVLSKTAGVVDYADSKKIVINNGKSCDTYYLSTFERSNASTCVNHRPIVKAGDKVHAGQVIADGPSCDKGELALGKNMTVAFMTFEGYNYEDAVILNERLVKDDVYTSLHISHYDIECRDTKLGPEEITRDIPNVSEDARKNLDADGIVRIGTEVREGDILVGKVTPKGMQELTSEEKLLHAIFGEKTREVRDTSLRVDHGADGIVHDVQIYTKENSDELAAGVQKVIRVYIVQKRKIQVGDKMSGRHGNKGVISLVVPEEDMPFMPDGRPVDIMLNPLGVPSRMNVGQILELHLGMAGKILGRYYATPVFDSATWEDVSEQMKDAKMSPDGKMTLYDGRTGEPFDNKIAVGVMYMIKLHHMVDDKLHARATGPYSVITQQPLGGKAQFGGQRFGEMEVWALYAYGAAHVLQEILTVKADDIVGRVKVYEALVKGKLVNQAGVPESFRVLVKEFQALCLDVQVLTNDDELLEFKDIEEKDDESNDNLRIDEIDLSTDEEVLPEPSKPFDEEEDDFDDEDEEPSLDDLEFPDDIDDMEGEGEE